MKMLMQADAPNEDIQGPLGDTAIVQQGGYTQPGLAYQSSHFGGMQQQLPAMSPQQQASNYHAMNAGPMMQQDMEMVIQQQQYPQQQPQQQQAAYGNGSYQGFNGGYQGPGPVSPQTRSQPMGPPYQGGYPAEHGFPQGTSASQTMGEFGPQSGSNQTMGITGPASLSLANLSAMSNRQHYYSEGYGMNQPVSPVRKQMQPSGGFLQPSRVPYSQQGQSYQSSSYAKKPSSSPGQNQMQGYTLSGSYTPRPNTGMQMPSLPYQSPASPYQPPHSPIMQSISTPGPQQDGGLYGRPHEPLSQPQSPFGPNQGQFQQPPQQHTQSSCMFVQPGTVLPQSQYQSQQLKSAGLVQRRASYPGQQASIKMPSPPLKPSPPSPLQNPSSPDLTRAIPTGFEARACAKIVGNKEKTSLPSASDYVQSGSVSQMKDGLSRNSSGGHKGATRQRRSTTDATAVSFSSRGIKKDEGGVNVTKAEIVTENVEGAPQKRDQAEEKEESKKPNGDMSNRSPQSQESKKNFKECANKGESGSCSKICTDQSKGPVIETSVQRETASEEQDVETVKDEKKDESESISSKKNLTSKSDPGITTAQQTTNVAVESVESEKKDEISLNVSDNSEANESNDKEVSPCENVKNGHLNSRHDRVDTNSTGEITSSVKFAKACGESSHLVDGTCQSSNMSGKAKEEEEEEVKPELDKSKIEAKTVSVPTNPRAGPLSGGALCEEKELRQSKKGEDGDGSNTALERTINTVDSVTKVMEKEKDSKGNKKEHDSNKIIGRAKEREESISKCKSLSETIAANCADTVSDCKEEANIDSQEESKPPLTDGKLGNTTMLEQKKPAPVSLRCEERLSSDDDERPCVPGATACTPQMINKTQGIQTVEESTVTPRSTHRQATSVKATIIAKGTSSQTNQEVMVAKTTTGQMYLIQGNILLPVQSLTTKTADSAIKANPKVIIVNPVKPGAGLTKPPHTTANTSDDKEKGKTVAPNNTDKQTSTKPTVDHKKSVERVDKADASLKVKNETKAVQMSTSFVKHTTPLSQAVQTTAIEKDRSANKTESSKGKKQGNSPVKQKKVSSPSRKSAVTVDNSNSPGRNYSGRGRPPGSKDKQKRKPFVHHSKRKEEDLDAPLAEPSSKRKFIKTASVVKEIASLPVEHSTTSKPPSSIDVPTVNSIKSPKRRKLSNPGLPVKRISVRPRRGIDGESWVCSLCGKRSGYNLLGDLYGPYKAKCAKEKTDSSPVKDSKVSPKLSLSDRKSNTSSDASSERKSSCSPDAKEEVETCDVELWVHRDCSVWSPGVFMLGRTVHGLEQAVESAAQHKCTKCLEVGATLACFKRGCNQMFHFACARDAGSSFVEDNFTIFCPAHKC